MADVHSAGQRRRWARMKATPEGRAAIAARGAKIGIRAKAFQAALREGMGWVAYRNMLSERAALGGAKRIVQLRTVPAATEGRAKKTIREARIKELRAVGRIGEHLEARVVAMSRAVYRFKPGNKLGGTDKAKLAQQIATQTRRMLHDAGPEMASALLELARNAEDERVRSVCIVAALDRAGFRPVDKPAEFDDGRKRFDPRAYTPAELARIEEALLLVVDPARARRARGEDAQEVIPPEGPIEGGSAPE